MADTITSSMYLSVKIPLERDGEETSRTISIPNPKTNAIEITRAIPGWMNLLRSTDGAIYLFQPTSWRDDDDEESAWSIKGGAAEDVIEFEFTTTTKTNLDYSNQ